jgi:hypothetical protein
MSWPVPGLKQVIWFANTLMVKLIVAIDGALGTSRLFPVSAVLVAQRPG